jgi:hypothetical protein
LRPRYISDSYHTFYGLAHIFRFFSHLLQPRSYSQILISSSAASFIFSDSYLTFCGLDHIFSSWKLTQSSKNPLCSVHSMQWPWCH